VEGKEGAAELLGVNPGTLRHRMRKLKIPFGRKSASIK
jgi:DNA-binding protein Fis